MAAGSAAGCGADRVGAEGRQRGLATAPEKPIAFTANQSGATSLVLADADGRRRVLLQHQARAPAWSPDGARLAFSHVRGEDSDIAVVEADGAGLRVITQGAQRDRDPTFSPDGGRIAFTREEAVGEGPPRAALYVVRTDGDGLRRVAPGQALDGTPAWSPDGHLLAFTRVTQRGGRLVAHVHLVAAGGGSERRLVQGGAPAWSPDGRRIAYVTERDRLGETCFHECAPSTEIHVVGADGRGDRRLTRSRADDADPAWTAYGRQIVFSSDRFDRGDHDRELYAMSATGACVTRLTNASSWSGEPAWRPGGAGGAPCARDGVAAGARQALADVDLRPARSFSEHRLLWLGDRHRGNLLGHAAAGDGGLFTFVYEDCGRPRATMCPAGVQVQNQPLCWWRDARAPVRLRRIGTERGAPVYSFGRGAGEGRPTEVHTGDTAVLIHAATRADLRQALAALRPLGGEHGSRLPPPERRCG